MSSAILTGIIFIGIIAITLGITAWASKQTKDTSQHYVAGGKLKGWQNGLALAGDNVSSATLLGVTGLIAVNGYTGLYSPIASLVGIGIVLLLVAEPLRNLGKYTVGDALTSRFNVSGIRSVVALSTITISLMYMTTQLVGGGAIFQLLVGVDYVVAVVGIGVLIAVYVVAGGMLGTTWIQIVQTILLLGAILVMALLLLARFSFNPLALFNEAAEQGGGSMFAQSPSLLDGLGWVSFSIAAVFGIAGLPHILIRFFTVPDAKAARDSAIVYVWAVGITLLVVVLFGYGAVALVGQAPITEADPGGNLAALQLADILGGPLLVAFASAAAFAALLSTVAGLVIAASGAFAHDLYNNIFRNGEASDQEQLRAARITAVLVSLLPIPLALALQGTNIALLVALSFAIAASSNFPVILLTLFWEKFNSRGAIAGILVGVVSSVTLVMLGTNVMGENAPFPLGNPALASVPIGFLGCYLGTVLSGSRTQEEREHGMQTPYEELYVRHNTGISDTEEAERETV